MAPDPDPQPIHVRHARKEDAPILASLMVEGLNSRLSDLGPDLVLLIHKHFISSRLCVCLVAESGDVILGYIAALISTRKFYREFFMRRGFQCALVIFPQLLKPQNWRTFARALTYSSQASPQDPDAELISLVVAEGAKRRGIATELFGRCSAELHAVGVDEMKIATGSENKAAHAFYEGKGCEYLRTERLYHDNQIRIYRYRLGETPEMKVGYAQP